MSTAALLLLIAAVSLLISIDVLLAIVAHHLGDLKAYTMTVISLLQQQVPPPPGTDWVDPFEYE